MYSDKDFYYLDFQCFIVPILKVFNSKYLDFLVIFYFVKYFIKRTNNATFSYRVSFLHSDKTSFAKWISCNLL